MKLCNPCGGWQALLDIFSSGYKDVMLLLIQNMKKIVMFLVNRVELN